MGLWPFSRKNENKEANKLLDLSIKQIEQIKQLYNVLYSNFDISNYRKVMREGTINEKFWDKEILKFRPKLEQLRNDIIKVLINLGELRDIYIDEDTKISKQALAKYSDEELINFLDMVVKDCILEFRGDKSDTGSTKDEKPID